MKPNIKIDSAHSLEGSHVFISFSRMTMTFDSSTVQAKNE